MDRPARAGDPCRGVFHANQGCGGALAEGVESEILALCCPLSAFSSRGRADSLDARKKKLMAETEG